MVKIETINLESKKQFELIDITQKVKDVLKKSGVSHGILTVFSPHTTAAVRINHNEPLLIADIMSMIYRLVPSDLNYSHDLFEIRSGVDADERSNGAAHVKTFLLGSSETIPITEKQIALSETQSIFFVELDGKRNREVMVSVVGE